MKFNFVENRKWFYIFSGILIILSVISFAVKGFQQDIEFSGGTVIDMTLPVDVDNVIIEGIVKEFAPNSEPRVQKSERRDEEGNAREGKGTAGADPGGTSRRPARAGSRAGTDRNGNGRDRS